MEIRPRNVLNYRTTSGVSPFREWLVSLRDRKARAAVRVRINRLRQGNLGDSRSLGEGVHELRIHYGPGYRVYFGILDRENVALLCGGHKGTQNRDIERAKGYWRELRSRAT